MKHNIVCTVALIVMLLLSLPTVAKEKDVCSNANIAGQWGTIMTGTIFPPTGGAVPFASVNRATYDLEGNYWGTQTRSNNGVVSVVTFEGTYILNSDCTGTKTTKSFNQSGILLNEVTQDFVLIRGTNELIEIFTSNKLQPSGTLIPTVITGHSKKLFPYREYESDENEGNVRKTTQ
jgi:hypothetical protein